MMIAMGWDPVPVFPVGVNPFAVPVVVAFNPDLSASGPCVYIGSGKGGHEN